MRTINYRLALQPELTNIYDVFHVSMLYKYHLDLSHVFLHEDVPIENDLSYEEILVSISDRQERVMRNKTIPMVKVL